MKRVSRTVEKGGVARVVTRGPGALGGPYEVRYAIFSLLQFSLGGVSRLAGPLNSKFKPTKLKPAGPLTSKFISTKLRPAGPLIS